jgi:hypothetical protein
MLGKDLYLKLGMLREKGAYMERTGIAPTRKAASWRTNIPFGDF